MTPINVRQLSDGEELVLMEGLGSFGTSTRMDARGRLSERRNQLQSNASGASPFVPGSSLGGQHPSAE